MKYVKHFKWINNVKKHDEIAITSLKKIEVLLSDFVIPSLLN